MIGDPVSALRQRLSAFFEKVRAGELLQIAPRDSMLSQPISPSAHQPTSRPRLPRIVVAARPR